MTPTMPTELRAVGDRVLVHRVRPMPKGLFIAGERLNLSTIDVMQFGAVVSVGNRFDASRFADGPPQPGDVIVYPNPRVHDHFEHDGRTVLIVPGYWVCAIIRDREGWMYGDQLV